MPGFVRTGFPGMGHQEHAVCSGKRGFKRFRTIEIHQDDFVTQLRMLGRIARQRAYVELTARLQRAHHGAALLTGCADDGDALPGVRHGCVPVRIGWSRATSRSERGSLFLRRGDGPTACVRTHRHTFRANEGDIRDAEKAEGHLQIGFLMIEGGGGRAFAVDAAARGGDDQLLAAAQSDRAVLPVAERLPGDGDAVDPGLQLRGNAKVVHRCADDHDVGCQECLERELADGNVGLQCIIDRSALCGRKVCCRQMANRCGGKVETRDRKVGVSVTEGRDDIR
ncbi:hypothethical protein (plasmid) [Ralstonia solanacearum PSI07]|nr:hypothethical protein [Ralstonia solanacearum PSI07]